MKKELTVDDRNSIRIRKVIEAELLIAQEDYNKDNKWYNYKRFDYNSFTAGFNAGMKYLKRIQQGHNLEDENPIKKET